MAAENNAATNMASYFFETDLIDKFRACFEEETGNNPAFQAKLQELSRLEFDNFQGSELLIKRMLETNKEYQFDEMKENLFKKFNTVLQEIMKNPEEEK